MDIMTAIWGKVIDLEETMYGFSCGLTSQSKCAAKSSFDMDKNVGYFTKGPSDSYKNIMVNGGSYQDIKGFKYLILV